MEYYQPCEDIVAVKTEVKNLKEKVSSLTGIDQALIRLTVLQENMVIENKKRDEMNEKQNETLTRLTGAIDRINDKLDSTDKKIDTTDKKVEALDNKIEENIKSGSVSFFEILKYLMFAGLGVFGSWLFNFMIN